MKPEAGLWDYLRARMPSGTHASRIEAPDTCPGFPDVHLTLKGVTWGLELKCNEFPTGDYPFRGEKHGLRRSQKIWIRDQLEARGKVMLILQYRRTIYFLDGAHFKSLDDMDIKAISHHATLVWDRDDGSVNHVSDLSDRLLS